MVFIPNFTVMHAITSTLTLQLQKLQITPSFSARQHVTQERAYQLLYITSFLHNSSPIVSFQVRMKIACHKPSNVYQRPRGATVVINMNHEFQRSSLVPILMYAVTHSPPLPLLDHVILHMHNYSD